MQTICHVTRIGKVMKVQCIIIVHHEEYLAFDPQSGVGTAFTHTRTEAGTGADVARGKDPMHLNRVAGVDALKCAVAACGVDLFRDGEITGFITQIAPLF